MTRLLLLLVAATACVFLSPTASQSTWQPPLSVKDFTVFEMLYQSLNGPNWLTCASSNTDPCNLCRSGVTCSSFDNVTSSITIISLPYNNLEGWLPDAALATLSHLEYLDLLGSNFSNTACLDLPMCHVSATCLLPGRLCPGPLESPTGSPTSGVIIIQDGSFKPTLRPSVPLSQQPSVSPTTLCLSPPAIKPPPFSTALTYYDLYSQFGNVSGTLSNCPPWQFGWIDARGDFNLFNSMTITGSGACESRYYGYYEAWGLESFIWVAFGPKCPALPLRLINEPSPIDMVMLHPSRLVTPVVRFLAPSAGLYLVSLQLFPGEQHPAHARLVLDANEVLAVFDSTDSSPATLFIIFLGQGQSLSVSSSAVRKVNVPLSLSVGALALQPAPPVCPTPTSDLMQMVSGMAIGSPASCVPFSFGYLSSAGTFSVMPGSLAGLSLKCDFEFASPYGLAPSLISLNPCTLQVSLAAGVQDSPAIRFAAQSSGSYSLYLDAVGVVLAVNGRLLKSVPSSLKLKVGDLLDLRLAGASGIVIGWTLGGPNAN